MLLELLRLMRKPQRYMAAFRNGEIYIEEMGTEVASTRASCVGPRRLSGRIGPARRLAPHSAAGFEPFATALWITATERETSTARRRLGVEPRSAYKALT